VMLVLIVNRVDESEMVCRMAVNLRYVSQDEIGYVSCKHIQLPDMVQ
jgi:hypothetical protein